MNRELGMLRLIICGSVDDGKSTLIGRLLLDSSAVREDQLAHIAEASKRRGAATTDLSLLTDGLRAERQQGITIDVAYRFFSTARRHFVLIDAPGHEQYTSNMVTGASQADVAVILIDASRGMTPQTRRHAYLVHLLEIPVVVFAVNKMDMVGYSCDVFQRHVREVTSWFDASCRNKQAVCIPVSALDGDNVVNPTRSMLWYDGPHLLEYIEGIELGRTGGSHDRMFVQTVIRETGPREREQRGYAGRVASGGFEVGQSVCVSPQGINATIGALERYGERVERVSRGQSVTIFLREDVDVGRGDLVCSLDDPAESTHSLCATLVWMGQEPLALDKWYAFRIGTRWLKARVLEVEPLTEAVQVARHSEDGVSKNDIVRAELRCSESVAYDAYQKDRTSGAFILVDQGSHETAAAGMLLAGNRRETRERTTAYLVVGTNTTSVAPVVLRSVHKRISLENLPVAQPETRGGGVVSEGDGLSGEGATAEVGASALPRVVGTEGGWYGRTLEGGARAMARKFPCSVVLAVQLEAGCFNHAMLTFQAIRRDGVVVDGWVAVGTRLPRTPDVNAEYVLLQQTMEAPHWGLHEASPKNDTN